MLKFDVKLAQEIWKLRICSDLLKKFLMENFIFLCSEKIRKANVSVNVCECAPEMMTPSKWLIPTSFFVRNPLLSCVH